MKNLTMTKIVDWKIGSIPVNLVLCLAHLISKGALSNDTTLLDAELWFSVRCNDDCMKCDFNPDCIVCIVEE